MEGGSRINALVDMGYDTFYPWAPGYERVFFVRLTFLLEQLSQQLERWDSKKYMHLVSKTLFCRFNQFTSGKTLGKLVKSTKLGFLYLRLATFGDNHKTKLSQDEVVYVIHYVHTILYRERRN